MSSHCIPSRRGVCACGRCFGTACCETGLCGGVSRSRSAGRPRSERCGFTLIDLLTSVAVVSVLIGLLLPTLAGVQEATRRTVCQSNLRQVGLAMAMYADDFRGALPYSRYSVEAVAGKINQPQQMILARVGVVPNDWDGLGVLYIGDYLSAGKVFYCPSHAGPNEYSKFADAWVARQARVVTNFQYRGSEKLNGRRVPTPERFSLVSDAFSSLEILNHTEGANVLRASLAVSYLSLGTDVLQAAVPKSVNDADAPQRIQNLWRVLDSADGTAADAAALTDPGSGGG
jgi:type II secretory pathway pseudopilin PulG